MKPSEITQKALRELRGFEEISKASADPFSKNGNTYYEINGTIAIGELKNIEKIKDTISEFNFSFYCIRKPYRGRASLIFRHDEASKSIKEL